MYDIERIVSTISEAVWGIPLCSLILVTGLLITWAIRGKQFTAFGLSQKYMFQKEPGVSNKGDISAFSAFCTAMAATVGTGNIVGVATAVTMGGAGALFWMVIAAFIGMATKYGECLLAVKYRVKKADGHYLGGPFMYIEKGLGANWVWLGKVFAFFVLCAGTFGIGTATQSNGIVTAVLQFFNPTGDKVIFCVGNNEITATGLLTTALVTILSAVVIIGGIKRIASVASIVIPFMCLLYIGACTIVLFQCIEEIPRVLCDIIEGAFDTGAIAGGASGTIMGSAIRFGIGRGVFSNEAGLGSAPIAVAAANTREPVRQGLINSIGVFIDTVVVCNLTGLVILVTDAEHMGLEGAQVTGKALSMGMPFPPQVGSFILMISLVFFAFTTIIGWNYYTERALEYLTGGKNAIVGWYRIIYLVGVFAGGIISVKGVWAVADVFNGLMALPNLIGILLLRKVIRDETKNYFSRIKQK